MHCASRADISMRHFPDVSDTSFQIPSFQDNTSGLLCENRLEGMELDIDHPFDDELGSGLDSDPFTTPLPISQRHSPLRLSEITPRRERECAMMAEAQGGGTDSSKDKDGDTERQREQNSSVRHALPKKESVDDMFERRKRDNYQQMGIDLSSKSTARLRSDKGEMERPDNVHTSTMSSNKPTIASKVVVKRQTTASGHHVSDAPKITAAKPKPKRPVIGKDAGIAKRKSRVVTSTAQLKSILKPSKPPTSALPPSTLTRTLTTASHTPEAECPRWGEVVAEVQQTGQRRQSSGSGIAAIGGGLIDVLVMYGEKLKGSLGFSSASKASTSQANGVSVDAHSPDIPRDDNPITYPAQDIAGPSSKPLRLSELSPTRSNRSKTDVLTLFDLSPPKHNIPADKENEMGREQAPYISPMRQSKKRSLTETSSQESKKSKFIPDAPLVQNASSQPISKRGKVTRTGLAVKDISRPLPLGASRTINKTTTQPRSKSQLLSPTDGNCRLGTATSSRDLKGNSHGKSTMATQNKFDLRKEQHPLVNLALPSGPAFASDVYRERALEKTQKERERKDTRGKEKRNFKAGFMPDFSKPAPPARPAVRPTIPAAFTFHSDARMAQRNTEFEEKRKPWESHAAHQALPMPDFPAIHAAQTETLRSRKVVPVLPTDPPALTTMVRAKEREKFEAERRERERVIEEQLEMRERERAEQEEKEYKEARKRTVPKAHEVPEWYKDTRKRKATT